MAADQSQWEDLLALALPALDHVYGASPDLPHPPKWTLGGGTAIAPNNGLVWLSEETVNATARLLEGVSLANGERLSSYPTDNDGFYPSFVAGFGPSLLGESTFRELRTVIEEDLNGAQAVQVFDLIVELGLQISFLGKEHCPAHMSAVNSPADEVEISRCSANMAEMLRQLGLPSGIRDNDAREVPFADFARAVRDNAHLTDMPERLKAFAACAGRHGASTVYWA